MWDFIVDNGLWIILGLAGIRFIIKDIPKLIHIYTTTDRYGDDDPAGNDNVNRKFHDYM